MSDKTPDATFHTTKLQDILHLWHKAVPPHNLTVLLLCETHNPTSLRHGQFDGPSGFPVAKETCRGTLHTSCTGSLSRKCKYG